jgi:photosystem II stability/assembly factor-like uncharacterized protein
MTDLDLSQQIRAAIDTAAEPVTMNEVRLRSGVNQSPNEKGVRPFVSSRRRVATLVVAAAALALLVGLVVTDSFAGGDHGRSAVLVTPSSNLPMRLVDSSSSPFMSIGGGAQSGDLECVTASVCYAANSVTSPDGWSIERTTDGGMTWHSVAALPNHGLLTWPLACPTTDDCFGSVSYLGNEAAAPPSPQLAVTTDGGTQWTVESVTIPPAFNGSSIDQISCATTQSCVVHVFNGAEGSSAAAGTFLTTDNAGATWKPATVVPAAASASLWTLKCDPDGACLGLAPTGSVTDPSAEAIDALRSSDDGKTWTMTSAHLAVGPGTLLISCGDAMHCLAAYNANNGTNIGLAITSDGGGTWKVSIAPSSWPNTAVSVSCADPVDCFVSASGGTQQGYANPDIEATHDGGTTWTPLTLPKLTDSPLVIVYPLSCPVAAGCIGVAATAQEFSGPRTVPPPGSIPPSAQRVIISNLSSSS